MGEDRFERKHKEDRPVLALCYDFDKTLTPDDMQAQGFIAEVGWDTPEFWAAATSWVCPTRWIRTWLHAHDGGRGRGRVIVTGRSWPTTAPG